MGDRNVAPNDLGVTQKTAPEGVGPHLCELALQLADGDPQDFRRLTPVSACVDQDVGHMGFLVFLEAAKSAAVYGLPCRGFPQVVRQNQVRLGNEDSILDDLV